MWLHRLLLVPTVHRTVSLGWVSEGFVIISTLLGRLLSSPSVRVDLSTTALSFSFLLQHYDLNSKPKRSLSSTDLPTLPSLLFVLLWFLHSQERLSGLWTLAALPSFLHSRNPFCATLVENCGSWLRDRISVTVLIYKFSNCFNKN